MYKFLSKNGQLLGFGLGIVIVILFLATMIPGLGGFDDLPEEQQNATGIFNVGLYGAIALVIIAAIAMVAFGLLQVITNLRGSVKGLIGFGIILAIFFIAFSTASGEATPFVQGAIDKFQEAGNGTISSTTLKRIGGGIWTMIVLIGLAFVTAAVSEILNLFK